MIGSSIRARANSATRVGKTPLRRRRGRRAVAFVVESLEERVMLTAWLGGTGNWTDAADWSGGEVPGSSDAVTIPAGSNVTISLDQFNKPYNAGAKSITTAVGSTLTITSQGSLGLYNGGTFNGAVALGGTIIGDASLITFAGTTVVTGKQPAATSPTPAT